MKTRNLIIYHCLTCGSVIHREPDRESPECCGHSMVKAATRTVPIEEVAAMSEKAGRVSGRHAHANCGFMKPR